MARTRDDSGGRADDINLWDALYRRRLALGPFYLGVGSAVLGGLSFLVSTWQVIVILIAVGLAITAWAATRVRDGLRRIYAYVVLGACLVWIFSFREAFPAAADWLTITWLSGMLLLGIPWWTSSVKRSQVKVEGALRDWPNAAKRIGMDRLKPVDVTMTAIGRRGRFIWAPGEYEVNEVKRAESRIEGAMHAQAGTFKIEPDGKSTNSVRWQIVERDPHAAPQMWPLPDHVGSATDPLTLGPRTDGEMVRVQRYVRERGVRHTLIAGQSDSGKSSLINLEVATAVCTDDIFVVGLDFKQVELAPWRPALGYMTSELERAKQFVRAVSAPGGLLDERAAIIAERAATTKIKTRSWLTGVDGPLIYIIVDEAKDLLGMGDAKTVDLFALIGTKGRALGVRFVLATQFPTLEAIGSSQIRQQARHRYCFRMQDDQGEHFVMPGHSVRADQIDADRPGTCYFLDGDKLHSMPIRILYLDDATVEAVATERAGRTAELDARSEAAICRYFPEFADRERYLPVDAPEPDAELAAELERNPGGTPAEDEEEDMAEVPEWNDGPDVDLADVLAARRESMSAQERDTADRKREAELAATAPPERLSEAEAKQAMLAALAAAWPEGVRAKELQAVATRGSSWFYNVANEMAEAGMVRRTPEHGTWALVAPPPKLVTVE